MIDKGPTWENPNPEDRLYTLLLRAVWGALVFSITFVLFVWWVLPSCG